MNQNEVVVEVGSEGGSVTLRGTRTPTGWLFSRHVIDQSAAMLDEVADEQASSSVKSWSAALKLLSEYPWVDLHPIEVHPEFRQRILDAVVSVYEKRGDTPQRRLEKWKEVCNAPRELNAPISDHR